MGCGCGSNSSKKPTTTKYELTRRDGTTSVYSSAVEARMQRSLAGGGTIKTIRTPITPNGTGSAA